MEPVYPHSCNSCIFEGSLSLYDIYRCHICGPLIVRWGPKEDQIKYAQFDTELYLELIGIVIKKVKQ